MFKWRLLELLRRCSGHMACPCMREVAEQGCCWAGLRLYGAMLSYIRLYIAEVIWH